MSVSAKIARVMKEVGSLSKDKRLQGGGNYEYLSEEKVTTELHAACADVGLIVFPTTMAILEDRVDTTNQGNIKHNVRIQATYRLMDADDQGSFVDAMSLGEGSDTGDKVLNKCMTAAYKYMLRQSFMISTGDDPDKEASSEATQPKTTAKRRRVEHADTSAQSRPKPSPSGVAYPCEWAGCDDELKATEKYPVEKLAQWSKEKCEGHILCYHHKQAWEAGERPTDSEPQATTTIGQAAREKANMQPKPEPDGMSTHDQKKRIHALAGNVFGKDADALDKYKGWLFAQSSEIRGEVGTGTATSKELTTDEADEIISRLVVLANERAEEHLQE